MSTRAAAAPAFSTPDRLADVLDISVVPQPVERLDRDLAVVIAGRAREEQREAERPDLAEQHRRERVATSFRKREPSARTCFRAAGRRTLAVRGGMDHPPWDCPRPFLRPRCTLVRPAGLRLLLPVTARGLTQGRL